jgi:hypothetical protein
MEAQYQIGVGNPSTGVDLSEQNVLSCSGGSCSGWYIDQALAFLYTSGTPDEACNPYTGTDSPCGSGRCSDYLSRTYRITGWSSIPTDTATIKNYLYTHGPVIVAMPVFCANPSCTTYDIPWYDTTFWQYYFYAHGPSSPYGYAGHAVVIVGWDDQGPGTADDYWIVRNSWGTTGGDVNSGYGGYFYMTQDPTTGFFGVYNEAYSISGVTPPAHVNTDKTTYAQLESISFTGTGFTPGGSISSCISTGNVAGVGLCVGQPNADSGGNVGGSMLVGTNIPPGPQKFWVADLSTSIDSNAVQLTITSASTVTVTVTRTLTESSTSYITRYTTTTTTSYTSTTTSTSTIPAVTTVVVVPLTVTSIVQSIQYLTSILSTTLTSYTGTQASTSTVVVPTTVVLVPSTVTSTAQSTQFLTSTTATTVTNYTSTETSTSTILVPTTIVLVPLTATSTIESIQYLTSTSTTTVTNYTNTSTSTSTSVVYTTVTVSQGGAGADASSPLAYLGFMSVLAIMASHGVTAGRSWRIPRYRHLANITKGI